VLPGGSIFDSATSFGMVRGGHVQVAILGACGLRQRRPCPVDHPSKMVKGIGRRHRPRAGTPRVVVPTEHKPKDGSP
jgi:3-oxoacid CoA-transferase subunit B